MGIDVDIDDICEFIDFDMDNDNLDYHHDDDNSSANTNTNQQPIINIINSTVTIGDNHHTTNTNHIIYDDTNDEYEFIFENSFFGTYGAPPSAGDDIEDDIHLDFGDIIEI